MPTIREILFSSTLTPQERRLYRIPLSLLAGVGAVAVGFGIQQTSETLSNDYGCATATVKPGQNVITAALTAAGELGLADKSDATKVIKLAAGSVPGANQVDPGQPVTTCVEYNPLNPEGYGNGGWIADVTLGETGE